MTDAKELGQRSDDDPQLVQELEEFGARLRRRKSGRLHTVDLSGLEVSELLPRLTGIARLAVLRLDGCQMDDAQLDKLPELPELTELTLDQNSITDDAVPALIHRTQLNLLSVTGNQISLEAIKQLRKVMLNTRIINLE